MPALSKKEKILGNGLKVNSLSNRKSHQIVRNHALGQFLNRNPFPDIGHYSMTYPFKHLDEGYGTLEYEVKYPGVIFTKTHCCLVGYMGHHHYIDLEKQDISDFIFKRRIPFQWMNHRFKMFPEYNVESLIKLGFDVNAVMYHDYKYIHRTIFSKALEIDRPDVALIALKHGANPHTSKQYTNEYGPNGTLETFIECISSENEKALIKMKVQLFK